MIFEITLAVVMIPASAHGVSVELSIDHVVNGLAAAFGIGFHVNGAGFRIERAFLNRDWIGIERTHSPGWGLLLFVVAFLLLGAGAWLSWWKTRALDRVWRSAVLRSSILFASS